VVDPSGSIFPANPAGIAVGALTSTEAWNVLHPAMTATTVTTAIPSVKWRDMVVSSFAYGLSARIRLKWFHEESLRACDVPEMPRRFHSASRSHNLEF
jgi:hypothetical protein